MLVLVFMGATLTDFYASRNSVKLTFREKLLRYITLKNQFPTERGHIMSGRTKQAQAVAADTLPFPTTRTPSAEELEELAGMGMETAGADDVALSRLAVAQLVSPQIVAGGPDSIDGLKAGEVFDATLGERLGESFLFLPVAYRKRWQIWGERSKKEGVLAVFDTPEILDECGPDARTNPKARILPSGHEVREAAFFFGWRLDDDGTKKGDAVIVMESTQLRTARLWLTLARGELLPSGSMAPLFWRVYKLSTRRNANAQGTWWTWHVDRTEDTVLSLAGNTADRLIEAQRVNEFIDEHPLVRVGHVNDALANGNGSAAQLASGSQS